MSQNPREVPDDFPTADNPPRREVTGERSMLSPLTGESWPCKRCATPVPIRQDALHSMQTMNRILAKKGEPPLDTRDVVWCEACAAHLEKLRVKQLDDRDAKIRQACAILRDPGSPAHLLGDAETYLARVANEGKKLVAHLREVRLKAGKARGGI